MKWRQEVKEKRRRARVLESNSSYDEGSFFDWPAHPMRARPAGWRGAAWRGHAEDHHARARTRASPPAVSKNKTNLLVAEGGREEVSYNVRGAGLVGPPRD